MKLLIFPVSTIGAPATRARVSVDVEAPGPGSCLNVVPQAGGWLATIPSGARQIKVSVTSADPSQFDQVQTFRVTATTLVATSPNAEFGPPVVPPGANPTVQMRVVLAGVRDVTPRCQGLLGRPMTLPRRDVAMLGPSTASALTFSGQSVTPGGITMLEMATARPPSLFAVAWPPTRPTMNPFQFVLFFHHRIGQNTGAADGFLYKRNGQSYPFGADFMEFGVMHYLDYAGRPLDGLAGGKGLAYQLAASGKNAALVLPVPSVSPDSGGALLEAGRAREVLIEIAGFAIRRGGDAMRMQTPVVGKVAVASFSSGAEDSAAFLALHGRDGFVGDTVTEAYRFEGTNDAVWRDVALAWASHGPTKRIRVYRQLAWDSERQGVYHRAGFTQWPAPGLRTFASLQAPIWSRAGARSDPWFETEAMIANTMLLDALQRSDF